MSGIAVRDLYSCWYVVYGHQYWALVDIESDSVGVTAVIDKRQGWVDGSPNSLQPEVCLQSVDLVSVVGGGADDLVDHAEEETFRLTEVLLSFQISWQNDKN